MESVFGGLILLLLESPGVSFGFSWGSL
ncbi:hypothetical protein BN874_2630001 [Candidatus Contendobacter odensis Run_B_J11]|uniref:Uncharacterized protein n=1 Tax=Candidatus Contendobacter odensis Run_B_J11 TaxID=1400861 RepID=A0A7U7GCF1_9GAMM|nr:hypothetical protein BN874_2630001 [Candidatus Contendobacter odensis Run_B_J11]